MAAKSWPVSFVSVAAMTSSFIG